MYFCKYILNEIANVPVGFQGYQAVDKILLMPFRKTLVFFKIFYITMLDQDVHLHSAHHYKL